MSKPVPFQTVIEYVEALSPEDQDLLLELLYKRRVEFKSGVIPQPQNL